MMWWGVMRCCGRCSPEVDGVPSAGGAGARPQGLPRCWCVEVAERGRFGGWRWRGGGVHGFDLVGEVRLRARLFGSGAE